MRLISNLSNAKFSGLREKGFASAVIGESNHSVVINGFDGEKFEDLMRNFDDFVELLKDALNGVDRKRSLAAAHRVFDVKLLQVLKAAGVSVVDAGNYSDSSLGVYLVQAPDPAGRFELKVPLRIGWRRFYNNSLYDAHARFEEVLHLLQFLNEAPLTSKGVCIEGAMRANDANLLTRLTKDWQGSEARRSFVRENDIMCVYNELSLELPGIFLFPYDRRAVSIFLQAANY